MAATGTASLLPLLGIASVLGSAAAATSSKMVVFGDSTSDAGRRFNAPASFDFDDIGPFPWTHLFEEPGSDSKLKVYLPVAGSPTNGKVWTAWLGVPEDHNFATSSASASEAFRSRQTCTGYTGEGEKLPTGTLGEQITRYFKDIVDHGDDTLDYTHIVAIGGNEPGELLSASARYMAGGTSYVDPVDFENVFEIAGGSPQLTYTPMIREIVAAWQDGIDRLTERGVTGRILLANLPSPRGFPSSEAASGLVATLDKVFIQLRLAAQSIVAANPQVRMLDFYHLSAAIVDDPEIFESVGFTGSSGSSLTDPCLVLDFVVDYQAEIMGTQDDRASGCQEECALCADDTFPCQNCFKGNPSATICAEPETYIFWDQVHLTTEFHAVAAEAIRECSKDKPDYDRAWVDILCPTN